jgi:hypothetical protein
MNRLPLPHGCHRLSRRLVIIGCASLVGVATLGAAEGVKSQWRPPESRVDGLITDWAMLAPVSKEVAVGAFNDGAWLQLAVRASEATTRQRLMSSGLIVYLDPAGKKSKAFGIRIPPLRIGRVSEAPPGGRGAFGSPPPADQTGGPDGPRRLTYVEVIGPGEDESRIVDLQSGGVRTVEAATGDFEGTLLIELAVPLRAIDEYPYSPNVPAGQKVVGLGLITPDEPPRGRGGRDGDAPGRGGSAVPRGGGMRGRGMGGAGMEELRRAGKSINVWTTIELAEQAAR